MTNILPVKNLFFQEMIATNAAAREGGMYLLCPSAPQIGISLNK